MKIQLPEGKFRCIVADPPWEYEGFASDPTSGRNLSDKDRRPIKVEALPYQSMTVEEICALPVGKIVYPDCRLFLWTTNRYLPSAFRVMAEWGFRYKQTLVWRKTGNPSPFGGSVAPNHAEFLIVGTRGNVPVLSRAKSSVIDAPAQRRHSRKPEAFQDMVELVSPGPRLELFARRIRPGWICWGDQLGGTSCASPGAEQQSAHNGGTIANDK
jgi:N6-adenosine-specific RNA methylase IME4